MGRNLMIEIAATREHCEMQDERTCRFLRIGPNWRAECTLFREVTREGVPIYPVLLWRPGSRPKRCALCMNADRGGC